MQSDASATAAIVASPATWNSAETKNKIPSHPQPKCEPFSHISPGLVIAFGKSIDAKPHRHTLWQLCLPTLSAELNGQPFDKAKVIPPNQSHQLQMEQGWIILAEPESRVGAAFSQLPTEFASQPNRTLGGLYHALAAQPELVNALKQQGYTISDSRIRKLQAQLDSCLSGHCLKPDKWRAKEIADWLALSESRFLHLAREQLGIAWRPYLLWRRLLCAVRAIKNGANTTQAAHLAGFSDAAHLSRTLKRTFGMTSSELLASFTLNKNK